MIKLVSIWRCGRVTRIGRGIALCGVLLLFSLVGQPLSAADFTRSPGFAAEIYAARNPWRPVIEVDQTLLAASAQEQPLWLHANRWGVFTADATAQSVTTLGLAQYFPLGRTERGNEFSLNYHLLGVGRFASGISPAFELNTGYIDLRFGKLQLSGGILPLEKGEHYGQLSSGSLVLSRNARPIPRVYFGFPDYIALPLTDGAIEVKGSISHGWLDDDRFISNPWLHEKDAYLRVNDPFGVGLSVYRGLLQETLWGGTNPDGTSRPNSFSDFLRVFRNDEGGEEASVSEQLNRLGDTVGMWDQGVMLHRPAFGLHLYHQHFFEDGSGYKMGRGEDWDERLKRWRDGLSGVHLHLPRLPVVQHFLYEFLYTKHQSGPGWHDETGGWDSYWEHGQYRSGWTHRGRMIGPALVTASGEGSGIFIEHSRILSHHIGLGGMLNTATHFRVLATYSSNHGTYARNVSSGAPNPATGANPDGSEIVTDSIFDDGLQQWSFLLEFVHDSELFGYSGLYGSAALGIDFGNLRDDSVGLMLTIGKRGVF